uniref:Uncharacterized protein n=1 Tax=Panagrolaimus davidi TaxID=227884 RepID=A0A914PTA4_9BILA
MNFFKLLVVFILLLLGSFAQRFQRHSINGTQNGNTLMEFVDTLSSDGDNYKQNGDDLKFVGNEREEVELELKNKKLMFKFCSDECMDKVVIACYDSKDSNPLRQGGCDPGQCEFKAGVSEEGGNKILWFTSIALNTPINDPNGICKTAIMKYPQATPDGILQFASCEPLKHDRNVVKLYIHQVPPECPLFVLNAKKWTPATITTTKTTQNSSETNQTTLKSSEANTTLWIGIGVGIFILLIVFIGFGFVLFIVKSVNAPKSKSLSGKKDSLSGRHETGMQGMVESPPESLKHHDFGLLNNETKKLEKFYTPDPVRIFDRREIELLCCAKISVIFKSIEVLIDITIKALAEREFVQSFAFGNVFREHIDSQARVHETFSIPLLLSIVLQRRYTVYNRRKPCTWIRRQLPIIQKEFTAKERSKLAFPICVIEAACKMNSDGFKNVFFILDSLSADDDDETQNSTHESEKLGKKGSDGRKKGSKKRR